jgi:outer membrane protein
MVSGLSSRKPVKTGLPAITSPSRKGRYALSLKDSQIPTCMLERGRKFKEITVRKLTLLASLILFPCSYAASNLSSLAQEYLRTNTDVVKSRSSATLSHYDWQATSDQHTWNLGWTTSYDNDGQESAPFFNSNPLKTVVHSASLTKDFVWGGKFSFDNTYTTLRGSNSFGGLNGRVHGFTQGVTYTQDLGANFLGRDDKLQIANAEENYKFSEASSVETIELGLLGFANSYTTVRLGQALLQLQIEAYERAVKRRRLIAGRVRDGLREKVDLYQSQLTEMTQSEEIQNAEVNLTSSIEALSKKLHRQVDAEEIASYGLESTGEMVLPAGKWQENKSLKKVDMQLSLLRGTLKSSEYSIMPTANLSANYSANDFNTEASEVFKEGVLGGVNNQVGVALNLIWPLGFKTQKIEKAKARVNVTTAEMDREKLRANYYQTETSLKTQLKLLERNLGSVQDRVKLATKALKEYNRLYNRGKADLDQVIRSEEDLINTQRSFVQYRAQQENLASALAQLYGGLESYLLESK